jgi:hypothetical protein
MSGSAQPTTRNRLLAAMPPDILSQILPRLRPFTLTVRDTLIVPEKAIEAVYFVATGFESLVVTLRGRRTERLRKVRKSFPRRKFSGRR